MDNLNLKKLKTFLLFDITKLLAPRNTKRLYKEVRQQVQFFKKYVNVVEFRNTFVTKLLNFNYLELDSAVHCTKKYVMFVIFRYTFM